MADELLKSMRQALAQVLTDGIDELQVKPYMLTNPSPPSAHLWPSGPVDFDATMQRGADEWLFTLQVFVAEGVSESSQVRLDEYLEPFGPRSVKAVLEADETLGGLVDDVTVTEASGYRRYLTEGRGPVLGCEWTVKVLAPGKKEA